MYRDIQPLRGSDAHTSVMYTTDNVHIWSMLLVSHVIMLHNYSIEINKRGLSSYDDKKHILDNGIETLSYGHYKI